MQLSPAGGARPAGELASICVVDSCPPGGQEEQLSAVRRAVSAARLRITARPTATLSRMGKIAAFAPFVVAGVVLASGGSGSDAWAAALVAAVVVTLPLMFIIGAPSDQG
jgi:hypothetical protein